MAKAFLGSLIAPFLTVWRILDAAFQPSYSGDFDGCKAISELEELEQAKLRLAAARKRMQTYMDNNSL